MRRAANRAAQRRLHHWRRVRRSASAVARALQCVDRRRRRGALSNRLVCALVVFFCVSGTHMFARPASTSLVELDVCGCFHVTFRSATARDDEKRDENALLTLARRCVQVRRIRNTLFSVSRFHRPSQLRALRLSHLPNLTAAVVCEAVRCRESVRRDGRAFSNCCAFSCRPCHR